MYVNLDILKTYADGDSGFLIDMIDKFNAEIPEVLKNLQKALDNKDWDNLRQIAHKMIGTMGVFNIAQITPLLQKIEQNCMSLPSTEILTPLVKEVKAITKESMKELEQEKAQL